MIGALRPERLPGTGGPVWFTEPPDAAAAVVLLHAPGENRTGNNYLLRAIADGCVRAGMAAVRFDLPGCGESREPLAAAAWDRRVDEVRAAVRSRWGGSAEHWVARGLSAALLPQAHGGGLRVALSPPDRETLLRLLPPADSAPGEQLLPPDDRALWTSIGAEPNLVGDSRVPVALVRDLAEQLAAERIDLAVLARDSESTGPALRMSTADSLFRFEPDQAALSALVPMRLKEWWRWRPEHS
jgi:hypothetical protein